jgi:hypothetical protein
MYGITKLLRTSLSSYKSLVDLNTYNITIGKTFTRSSNIVRGIAVLSGNCNSSSGNDGKSSNRAHIVTLQSLIDVNEERKEQVENKISSPI